MPESRQDQPKPAPPRRRLNPAVGFGTSFAVGMAVFAFLGHALDVKTGKEPLFTLAGIGLGLLYGGWELWKLATASGPQSDRETSEKDTAGGTDDDARQS